MQFPLIFQHKFLQILKQNLTSCGKTTITTTTKPRKKTKKQKQKIKQTNKKPRGGVAKAILYNERTSGGITIPDFEV